MEYKSLSLWSLFFGLLFWVPLFNFVFGPLAAYLGAKAIIEFRKKGKEKRYLFLAVIGCALGMLPLLFSLVKLSSDLGLFG